ncbi:MAG: DinB family protein [Vicinamibacterales bacterium]
MSRVAALALAATLATLLSAPGETQAPPPSTYEAQVARAWISTHDKILAMAKDTGFPDDKLGWRPHPDSRSVLEELRHVTIGLEMSTANLQGKPFDYEARDKADAAKPQTRASVVAEMEAAIAASYPLVKSAPKPLLVFWIEHQGEHYGKLVSDYRVLGVVPPISRPSARKH